MLTTSERRRDPFTLAVLLSLLVHLMALLAYVLLAPRLLGALPASRPPNELVALSDAIRLEKRTIPRSAPRPVVPPPAARMLPVPQPARVAPPPAAPRPEVAHIVRRAPPVPRPAPRAQVAYEPAPRPARPNALTQAQLAAYEREFSRTIVAAQAAAAIAPPPKEPPAASKRYDFVMNGTLKDLLSAQGEVTPLQSWVDRSRRLDWYYIRVHVVYSDGSSETVDIPWPVSFAMDDDPVATHAIFHHIPDPPPGYALPHPFPISRLVCTYYKDECQAVLDAEDRNGGRPASN